MSLVTKLDGEAFFHPLKVLKEEGYLKIVTNSFCAERASDSERRKNGNGEEDEVSCDTVLLEALQKLKKGDILPVNGLKYQGGRDFAAQTIQFRFHDPCHGKCRTADRR